MIKVDTSEQYIKMCEKAGEIQGLWEVSVGDFYCCTERDHNRSFREPCVIDTISVVQGEVSFASTGIKNHCRAAWFYPQHNVWLPRQDQLQEMVEEIKDKNHFIFRFYHFLKGKYLKVTQQNAYICLYNTFDDCSMEKLWFAFVFYEKYHKKWDGENWIQE